MKKLFIATYSLLFWSVATSQTVSLSLQKAFTHFESDSQLKYASSSLYVVDASSGKVLFDKNSRVGLAPASTQKIITSVTAFELLGKDFRFKTDIGFVENGPDKILYIAPSGDPTLGSDHWSSTTAPAVIKRFMTAIKSTGFATPLPMIIYAPGWSTDPIPGGWLWEDMGNYYGAGASALNWRENQYDILLHSGNKIGDSVEIVKTEPQLYSSSLSSFVVSAPKGSGDNTYVYLPSNSNKGVIRGTVPVNEKEFKVSGAMANPPNEFFHTLVDSLPNYIQSTASIIYPEFSLLPKESMHVIYTNLSPALDSIIHWFNKKSINLYGEALLKKLALDSKGIAATDSGVSVIKKFWKQNGIDPNELHLQDGSGLSPMNRVTTHAQVQILNYARSKPWFNSFFNALPEYNDMHMKSGTIGDVKAFCGYHTAKNGKEYIFSFIVNNYNGSTGSLVRKMYGVLDVLK